MESTKKSLGAFGPQVQQSKRNHRVDLVQEETAKRGSTSITSTSALIATMEPKSDFEREFRQAVEESGISWHDKTSVALPPTPAIQEDKDRRQMARIRTLLRAEQIRSRRLKNIKSKAYRKLVRQKETRSMQDLIAKLDKEDPEAAEHIRSELERKLSNLRLNRQRQARIKWSQAAQRFGGREIRTEVSRQAQADADQRKDLIRAVKGKGEGHSSGDESDESFDSSDEDIVSRVKHAIKSNVLDVNGSVEAQKGVMGMKFMREAETRKRNATVAEANSFIETLEESASDSDADSGSVSDHDAAEQSQQDLVASLFSTEVEAPPANKKTKKTTYRLEEPKKETDGLPGWGDWAGEGVKKRKMNKKKELPVKSLPTSALVQMIDDAKLAVPLEKYQVKDIPYPYRSKKEFELAQARPLGPEWQSLTSHAEIIQPKVCARLGAIVAPIVLAKHLSSDSRAKIIDAWDNRKRIKHTKARFL